MRSFPNKQYPSQFWLLSGGLLVSTIGNSMIWPFLTIFLTEKLDLPLSQITLLLTIKSFFTLVSSYIAGPMADQLGRKALMVISLTGNAVAYLLMIPANSFLVFAGLMALSGIFNPLFGIGSNAMIADMLPSEQRANGYALLRMVNNAGIAIGPMMGGFIAASSYNLTFEIGAACLGSFALFILLFIAETLPQGESRQQKIPDRDKGYGPVLKDRLFMAMCGALTLTFTASIPVFSLLSVYVKENFGIPENQFGGIMATNALMVVFFQFAVTRLTAKHKPFIIMAIGGLLYAIGVGSISLGHQVYQFQISMVILTLGELMIAPTATALTADLSPQEMRGRYMSIFGLTYGVASGLGPLIGGFLNDAISPAAIWYGGMIMALISVGGYLIMRQEYRKRIA